MFPVFNWIYSDLTTSLSFAYRRILSAYIINVVKIVYIYVLGLMNFFIVI